MQAATLDDVIGALNKQIVGGCNYDKTQVSKQVCATLENLLGHKSYRWAKRKHPHKSAGWI